MPVTLATPLVTEAPDTAKVVAFKVENNVEHWIEVWVAFGNVVDGNFVECRTCAPLYLKIENGCNPHASNTSLRKCPECDLWFGLEANCSVCGGQTDPYDGFSRLAATVTAGGVSLYDEIASAIYAFLTSESVPNPDTGEVAPLLEGE